MNTAQKTLIATNQLKTTHGLWADAKPTTSHGLIAGTHVASNLGWRAVDALSVGDKVLTFDNAMQTVVEIRRETLWSDPYEAPELTWPVHVPKNALGNRCALTLMPDQGIMVESDATEDAHGDPFAVIPALSMIGLRGIDRVPPRDTIEVITLFFADDQVVYVEGGVLAFCPRAGCLVSDMDAPAGAYEVLGLADAEFLVECMKFEDHVEGNTQHMPPQFAVA